jgi:hypothetical protein
MTSSLRVEKRLNIAVSLEPNCYQNPSLGDKIEVAVSKEEAYLKDYQSVLDAGEKTVVWGLKATALYKQRMLME